MSTKEQGYDAALSLINAWIKNMERCPGMWGSAEALEFQMLQLVEIRQLMVRPAALAANPHETREAHIKWVAAINGECSSAFLHCILRDEGRLGELPKLLCDFARWVAAEYPPEVTQ